MKKFTIRVEDTRSTSMHRWAPDPHKRGSAFSNKKKYTRKGQPKVGPSDLTGVLR